VIRKLATVPVLMAVAEPDFAGSDLASINVLLEPDAKMVGVAKDWNENLRGVVPDGFPLDQTHRPNATLIQQHVSDGDLAKALAAVKGGAQGAFVEDPTRTALGPALFSNVETFVPGRSGVNYHPHVSTGVAPTTWLEAWEAEPFAPFKFGPNRLSVYRLGNFGTAAELVVAN
jgi:hypothetical protein